MSLVWKLYRAFMSLPSELREALADLAVSLAKKGTGQDEAARVLRIQANLRAFDEAMRRSSR